MIYGAGGRRPLRYRPTLPRTDITMTTSEIEVFLAEPRTLQVATVGRDGFPYVASMWYLIHEGNIAFRSFSKSQKIANLRRDPRVTVLAEDGGSYAELRGVMIQGTARLITDRAIVLDWFGQIAARYPFFGEEPTPPLDADANEAAFGRFAHKNTGVIVDPVKVISWDHRKLAGEY